MPYLSKREVAIRIVLTIDALERKNGVTTRELSEILELNNSFKNSDYRPAQSYIDVVSQVRPVIEIGERKSAVFGRSSTVYRIIKQGEI